MLKTNVTLEQCEVPDGYEAVRYGHPKRGELFYWRKDVSNAAFDFDTDTHLIVRRIEPPRVPLEAKDVVVGKTLIRNKSAECSLVMAASEHGVTYAGLCFDDSGTTTLATSRWSTLFDRGEMSNDHGATWQPCSKPGR